MPPLIITLPPIGGTTGFKLSNRLDQAFNVKHIPSSALDIMFCPLELAGVTLQF
jgi:hypothetical protein